MYYYLDKNAQDNGIRVMHKKICKRVPSKENRIELGYFTSCNPAFEKAKELFDNVDGCPECSAPCHNKQ